MNYELPQRKPNRMAGYDYNRNGAYFVTICTIVGADIIRPRIPDIIRTKRVGSRADDIRPYVVVSVVIENYWIFQTK